MISSSSSMRKFDMLTVKTGEVYRDAAQRLGLSESAMWILYVLAQTTEPLTQAQLSVMCGISKQTIHSSVAKLVKDGILEPQTSARNSPLRVTKKGEDLIREKIHRLIDAENTAMDAWTREEQKQFLQFNEEYLNRLKEQVEKF